MSETAQTLIKAAMRAIGAIASGEDPTSSELQDGLEAMKLMLRHWSDSNLRLYYVAKSDFTLTGAEYYTIGPGGDFDVARPVQIRGASIDDNIIRVTDADKFRKVRLGSDTDIGKFLWYNPSYPLGNIWIYPTGGTTLSLDYLIPLSDPSGLTATVEFPPGYDEAIKWNLALRLCPEYGKEPSPIIVGLARSALTAMESKNFASQVNAVESELVYLSGGYGNYNIDEG